jgi:hypothetical protein
VADAGKVHFFLEQWNYPKVFPPIFQDEFAILQLGFLFFAVIFRGSVRKGVDDGFCCSNLCINMSD